MRAIGIAIMGRGASRLPASRRSVFLCSRAVCSGCCRPDLWEFHFIDSTNRDACKVSVEMKVCQRASVNDTVFFSVFEQFRLALLLLFSVGLRYLGENFHKVPPVTATRNHSILENKALPALSNRHSRYTPTHDSRSSSSIMQSTPSWRWVGTSQQGICLRERQVETDCRDCIVSFLLNYSSLAESFGVPSTCSALYVRTC